MLNVVSNQENTNENHNEMLFKIHHMCLKSMTVSSLGEATEEQKLICFWKPLGESTRDCLAELKTRVVYNPDMCRRCTCNELHSGIIYYTKVLEIIWMFINRTKNETSMYEAVRNKLSRAIHTYMDDSINMSRERSHWKKVECLSHISKNKIYMHWRI